MIYESRALKKWPHCSWREKYKLLIRLSIIEVREDVQKKVEIGGADPVILS